MKTFYTGANWDAVAAAAAMAGAAPQPAATVAEPGPPERVLESAGATLEDEDKGWRSLSGRSKRDLSPLAQDQMQRLAAYLWEANLLANRLIELPVSYLTAEGVRLECDDPEHQQWLDAFWHDPINKLDLRLPTFVRELALFGEQCWPVYVNDINGHVRIGYLDPSLIGEVVMDPGNAAQEIGVRTVRDAAGTVRQFRVIVRGEDDELFAPEARALRAGYTSGDTFYFAINKFAAGRRGRSDLIAAMDWLDGYDEFMFDQMERAGELDAFLWDVELEGADESTVNKRAGEITRPGRGSVRVHNSAEKWTAVAPSLNAVDRAESARMYRNHIAGGATIPEHWFGGGGDVNRATAGEMGEPFFKVATSRQTVLRHILQEIGCYVLWQRARHAGETPDWGDARWKVRAVFPEMVTKDTTKLASALQACIGAVVTALGSKLISRRTALLIIAVAAKRLDVDIDPEAELAAAEEENPEPPTEGDDGVGVPPGLGRDDDEGDDGARRPGQAD